ncbi:MAG: branched-chain amino acid ABC transporter permease [Frankiales bacterium]|nr:branched-chain amino acid ABC transporter permease [Frankiales bacterium]
MTITTPEIADSRPVLALRTRVGRYLGVLLLVALAAWLVWNLVAAPEQWVAVAVAGLRSGSLYALIALGYTLVYGIIGLINFAHGDLFMLASVASSILLVQHFGADAPGLRNWLLALVVMAVVMALGAGVNVTAERLVFRRLRRAPRVTALIAAVGLSFVFQWLGLLLNGSGQRTWSTVVPNDGLRIGPVSIAWSSIVITGATIPLLLALSFVVRRTRRGLAMRATSQDHDAARLMGIDVDRTIAFTFAVGGAMAGAAGLLYFATFGNTNYSDGYQFGLIAFTAAVLGGVGNLPGAVLGGYLIGEIQAFNDGLPYGLGQGWSQTVVFSVLILVMVFRPEGILGTRVQDNV